MKIVCIIFSKDRAMQLHLLLFSLFFYCTDSKDLIIKILYKGSSKKFICGYNLCKKYFSNKENIWWIKEKAFKKDLLLLLEKNTLSLFLVDDTLFYRRFDLQSTASCLLKNNKTIGFSYRLGSNTDFCYPHNKAQKIPDFMNVNKNIYKYHWKNQEYDFGYPLEVSSSLYRTNNLIYFVKYLSFYNPNTFEQKLSFLKKIFSFFKPELLCFKKSVAFSNPINKTQTIIQNRAGNKLKNNINKLNAKFLKGYIFCMPNNIHKNIDAAHVEVDLKCKKKCKTLLS